MDRRTLLHAIPVVALLGSSASADPQDQRSNSATPNPVYELRIYHAYEGKLEDLLARFRDHTMRLFEKHGIRNVVYWAPTDDPLKGKTLVYVLAHASREAADANWQAFRADPEWQSVREKSEANGKLVEKIDSTYLARTPFSPVL